MRRRRCVFTASRSRSRRASTPRSSSLSSTPAAATLQWIASALGAVRDLDVQLAHIDDWGAEMEQSDAEGLTVVADMLRRRRLAARRRMLRVLDCPRYETFIARFTTMVRGPLP